MVRRQGLLQESRPGGSTKVEEGQPKNRSYSRGCETAGSYDTDRPAAREGKEFLSPKPTKPT